MGEIRGPRRGDEKTAAGEN